MLFLYLRGLLLKIGTGREVRRRDGEGNVKGRKGGGRDVAWAWRAAPMCTFAFV